MAPRVDAFRQGLRELGYVEGKNITIEYRWADGRNERLRGLAAELAQLKVGIVVAHGVAATAAAQKASATIPIVCFACGDLLVTGLVTSLARPGGNITGQTIIAPDVTGKRLELLREVVPSLNRVAILWNPDNPVSVPELKETEAAARLLGLQLQSFGVNNPDGFRSAFASMTKERSEALVVFSDAMFFGERKQIADLATRNRLPAISWTSEFAKSEDSSDTGRMHLQYLAALLPTSTRF
jgi:putative ABC transport system substrate-binding protein